MAWSWIQSASASFASHTGITATYSNNVQAGTKLIAVIFDNSAGASDPVTSVKDGALNAMTQLIAFKSPANSWTELWAMDTPAGDAGTKPTITFTLTSGFNCVVLIQEISGLALGNTISMIDGSGGTNLATSTGPATTGAYSSTAANEYLLAIYGDGGSGKTVTNPAGYTPDTANINAGVNGTIMAEYKNSSNGSESASYPLSGTAAWMTLLVAFKVPQLIPLTLTGQAAAIAAPKRGISRSMAATAAAIPGSVTRSVGRVFTASLSVSASAAADVLHTVFGLLFKLGVAFRNWIAPRQQTGISALATYPVLVNIAARQAGELYSPVSDTVQFAFMPTPTQVPQVTDWVSGSWISQPGNVLYPQAAQCIVGAGGSITLGIGRYYVYVKVTDSPEVPVLYGGIVDIT